VSVPILVGDRMIGTWKGNARESWSAARGAVAGTGGGSAVFFAAKAAETELQRYERCRLADQYPLFRRMRTS